MSDKFFFFKKNQFFFQIKRDMSWTHLKNVDPQLRYCLFISMHLVCLSSTSSLGHIIHILIHFWMCYILFYINIFILLLGE